MRGFGTLPITSSWAGSLTPPDLISYNQTIFVASASNIDSDGSLQAPYHSIAEGIADAIGRSPTIDTPICIYIYPGIYSEANLTLPSYIYLQGANQDSTVIRHSNNILTLSNDNVSISSLTFQAMGLNSILVIDGTSLTVLPNFTNCSFLGAGNNNNVIAFVNGGKSYFYNCKLEAENVGDRILQTDSDSDTDIKILSSTILGDIYHSGGDIELTDITGESGLSCLGSSNLNITDSFIRNSVDHTIELSTIGNVYLYRSTFISPGLVDLTNYYTIRATVQPAHAEWIDCSFVHDLISPDYSIYSTVPFTYVGDRNDIEFGYNANVTDSGLPIKGTPVDHDLLIIEDSEDNFKRKRVELGDLPGGTGGGGASDLSELTIDTNKDWEGFGISNLSSLEITDSLTIPSDATATGAGDLRYNTTEVALEYYDGSSWHDAGSPLLISVSGSTLSPGNHSIAGLKNRYLIKTISIQTNSTDWDLTLYSRDDYVTGSVPILRTRSGDIIACLDMPYIDADSTSEIHYNFTNNSGIETYNIQIQATSLR